MLVLYCVQMEATIFNGGAGRVDYVSVWTCTSCVNCIDELYLVILLAC